MMKVVTSLLVSLALLYILAGQEQKCFAWETYTLDPTVNYTVSWNVSGDNITFILSLNDSSWCGIGFHPVGSTDDGMINADIWTVEWNTTNYTPIITDRYAKIEDIPPRDIDSPNNCTDDVLYDSIFGTQVNNQTQIQFTRKLVTKDQQCDVPITPGTMNVIWARRPHVNNLFYHMTHKGKATIAFISGNSSTTTGQATTEQATTGQATTGQPEEKSIFTPELSAATVIGVLVIVIALANLGMAIYCWKRKNHNTYKQLKEEDDE